MLIQLHVADESDWTIRLGEDFPALGVIATRTAAGESCAETPCFFLREIRLLAQIT
jgi:hypothetical protein